LKALTLIFVILIASLQYPLWLGKGSWLRVWDLNHQIENQKEKNEQLKARNDGMDEEVHDLKQGYGAIEERARSELGMVKQDEVFYQLVDPSNLNQQGVGTPPPVVPVESEPVKHIKQDKSDAKDKSAKNKKTSDKKVTDKKKH
jgi:cell division protein FtsB